MKKFLGIFFVTIIMVAILVAIPASADVNSNQGQQQYKTSYYTGISQRNDGIECKIATYEELANQFPDKDKILSKYDEEFFKDKFLYRIGYELATPAWSIMVSNITNTADSISIELEVMIISGGIVAQVIVPCDVIIEMDKADLNKNISSKVQLEWGIDTIYDEAFGRSNTVLVKIRRSSVNKTIKVGDDELYYSSQKNAYFGLVDTKYINVAKTVLVSASISNVTPVSFTYGNLDEDEEIDTSDLQSMKLAIKGSKALDGKYLIASDVNGDGLCDTADLQEFKLKIKSDKEFSILK